MQTLTPYWLHVTLHDGTPARVYLADGVAQVEGERGWESATDAQLDEAHALAEAVANLREPPEDDAPPPSSDDAPLWLQDEPEAPAITRLRREWLGELTRQTAWGGR